MLLFLLFKLIYLIRDLLDFGSTYTRMEKVIWILGMLLVLSWQAPNGVIFLYTMSQSVCTQVKIVVYSVWVVSSRVRIVSIIQYWYLIIYRLLQKWIYNLLLTRIFCYIWLLNITYRSYITKQINVLWMQGLNNNNNNKILY